MTHHETDIDENKRPKLHHLTGSAALLFAAAILFLALIDRGTQLPFMPSSWFSHRAMWYFLAVGSFVASVILLMNPPRRATDRKTPDDSSEIRFQSVILYTRKECPLCEEAKETLHAFHHHLPPIEERDIDDDPELVERFGDCVPVVVIDDKIRFRGRISETLLQRLIDGAAAQTVGSPT